MDYLNRTPENLSPSIYNFKERSRRIILNLGYDYIRLKRNLKKDLNRLKYRLPNIMFNN